MKFQLVRAIGREWGRRSCSLDTYVATSDGPANGGRVDTKLSRVMSPAPRDRWLRLVREDPSSTLCHSPQWTDALSDYTQWSDASRYYETTDGTSFVVPLLRRGPRGAAGLQASMPSGWGMGGLVGPAGIRSADVSASLEDVRSLNTLGLRILPNPLRGALWSEADLSHAITLQRYAHVLRLDRPYQSVWADSYHRSTRQNVRKAARAGLDVDRDTTGRLIAPYRELFRRSVDRWADRSHEPRWLARMRANREDAPGKLEFLAKRLGESMVTWVAWFRGEPAASLIILRGTSVFAWRSAMDADLARATCAGHLLHHHAIREACKDDAAYYHLGESGPSCGLCTFKERFGATGYRYPEVRFEHVPFTSANLAARSAIKRLVGYQPA
jgi:hypothetical protein